MIPIPNPFNIDWAGMIDGLLRAIFLRGRTSFGERMYAIAKAMSERQLPDFALASWSNQWAFLYTISFALAVAYNLYAGARIGFAGRNLDKEKISDALHPGRVILAGIIIPALLVVLMFFVEAGRQMALYGVEGQDWSKPFGGLVADGVDFQEWAIGQIIAGVISWLLSQEVDAMTHLVYAFSSLLILGYVFVRKRRMRWLFQVAASAVMGLSVAYPLQILILRFGAGVVGDSYGTGIVITAFVAALPIIAGFAIGYKVDFVRLAGGTTTISGETTTSPDDRTQNVKVTEEIDARLNALQPLPVTTMDRAVHDAPTGMLPNVPGADPHDTLVQQHAAFSKGGEPEGRMTDVSLASTSGSAEDSPPSALVIFGQPSSPETGSDGGGPDESRALTGVVVDQRPPSVEPSELQVEQPIDRPQGGDPSSEPDHQ